MALRRANARDRAEECGQDGDIFFGNGNAGYHTSWLARAESIFSPNVVVVCAFGYYVYGYLTSPILSQSFILVP